MRGSGGTEGGLGLFVLGFCLSALAAYLFFDSVRVDAGGYGLLSGLLATGRGGPWGTASTGILFLPFLSGIAALFYDSRQRWAWGLMSFGLAVLAIEVVSRIQFFFHMKLTHFLLMVGLFGAGVGLMLRSFRDEGTPKEGGPREDR